MGNQIGYVTANKKLVGYFLCPSIPDAIRQFFGTKHEVEAAQYAMDPSQHFVCTCGLPPTPAALFLFLADRLEALWWRATVCEWCHVICDSDPRVETTRMIQDEADFQSAMLFPDTHVLLLTKYDMGKPRIVTFKMPYLGGVRFQDGNNQFSHDWENIDIIIPLPNYP